MSGRADAADLRSELQRLRDRVCQLERERALTGEISQAACSLRVNDVLSIVTERVAELLGAHRCAVFLLDPAAVTLVLRAVRNGDSVNNDVNLAIPLAERPQIEQAVRTGRPAQIRNVFADDRLRTFWDKARELDVKAQLAVPLLAKQEIVGAIVVDRGTSLPPFSQDDVELCQAIARQAAAAIHNAQLFEEAQRRADRLWLVNRVSHQIGAILDIDLLLWEVVRLIQEALNCYHAAIALIEGDELVFKSGLDYLGRRMPGVRLSLQGEGEGVVGWVIRHGQSLMVPDVRQDRRYKPLDALSEARSQVAVPLRASERAGEQGQPIIGVLDVRSDRVGAFSADDLEMLEALAAQVAVAIESARHFTQAREERAIVEALIEGTGDAIVITDADDRIVFFNPAAREALLNGDPLELGSRFGDLVHNEALLGFWSDAPGDGNLLRDIPLSDGRTFQARLSSLAGVGRVVVMRDITRLKEMDAMKSDFVSAVSHDLRSPLQVIRSSAELLPLLGDLNADQRREVEHILFIVRRISELVQNLLDISRIEAGVGMDIEPCAVNEVIASAAGSCRSQAQAKGLDFTVDLPRTLPLVRANRARLDQVISNLVQNAIKFTSEGSVSVVAWADERQVVIEVHDTGVGIPSEAQDKLFQKFYRVKRPETRGIPGTGLGLAIVRSIVESYGGRVELESYPRLGSTFTVVLPIYEGDARATGQPAAASD